MQTALFAYACGHPTMRSPAAVGGKIIKEARLQKLPSASAVVDEDCTQPVSIDGGSWRKFELLNWVDGWWSGVGCKCHFYLKLVLICVLNTHFSVLICELPILINFWAHWNAKPCNINSNFNLNPNRQGDTNFIFYSYTSTPTPISCCSFEMSSSLLAGSTASWEKFN